MKFSFLSARMLAVTLATLATLSLAACNNDDDAPAPQSITDIVLTNNDFTLLRAAVQRAGLADALRTGTLTVFAPNDAAFRAAGFADVAAINAAPVNTLTSILQYHVLGTRTPASAIPTADNTSVNTLGNVPLFITRNAAGVSVNGIRVITPDVDASNGVIHIIEQVLLPPAGNLVQVAQGNPNFSLLVAAVLRASQGTTNVAQVLSGPGPLTVFAPTDAAFQAAGFTNAAAINAADPAALTRILTYHVVPARVFSTNLAAGNVATAQGGNVTIGLNPVTVRGNGNGGTASNVTQANIVASNGVIHVIDRVLLP
ncbi:MAG: fasciclin domain-containing protein [Bernardetiaceae bacterium]|jgi:uncharacterized surface protein with fasciclin (FAS1) repeats|nr:fasciclin domain-containing protein [Bernardetiaceae bacterium]